MICLQIFYIDFIILSLFRIFWVLPSVCIICSSLQCRTLRIVLWIWQKPKLVCVINRTACKRSLRRSCATNTCKRLLRSTFILCGFCVKIFLLLKFFKFKFLFLAAETAYVMPSARVNTGQTNDSHSSVSLKKYCQIALPIVLLISCKGSSVFL